MSTRTKRRRRTARQVIKFGTTAKRRHAKRGGRTGQIKEKSTPAKHRGSGVVTSIPWSPPKLPPWLTKEST